MNKFAKYTDDQLEELFSLFLLDSWSYSGTSCFSRNEKDFERSYIYRVKSKRGSSAVAGNAYHKGLELFFGNLKEGVETSIIDIEQQAFTLIDDFPANSWKLQKTTPTIEQCKLKATTVSTNLLANFMKESNLYTEDLDEILGVEMYCDEWLVINGVDIPLPCHAVIDLVVRLKDGRVVIIDHKSKNKFTDEKEVSLVFGKQAVTYMKAFETKTGIKADEVWFIENKYSANRDKSAQLCKHVIVLDADTRKLYEALLYEPLKRMLEAVSDPDYVFTINDSDNFTDKAELYEFWMTTMIAEVDDFDIPESKRELISKRLRKIRDASIAAINPKTITAFRENAASFIPYDLTKSNMTNSEKIEHVLRSFSILAQVAHEIAGFSSNTYLLEVSAGVKIANVAKYKLDIASALNVSSVRIGKDLTIFEDKSYLSIETSKKRTEDLIFDPKYLDGERLPIGIDNFDRTIYWDLNNQSTPHMLVCGSTGSGKSVSVTSTIAYAKLAGITDIIIFDPKYEFCNHNGGGIRVYNEIEEIEEQMKLLVENMQARAKTGGSNSKTLIVFDEFADAVSASRSGKELDVKGQVQIGFYAPKKVMGIAIPPEPKFAMQVISRDKSLEENLKMLLQKGRSLGFRIVAATQRASVKVITGDAKINFPVQMCFRVPKEIDSKVVLDEAGAETLVGAGDGLFKSPEYLDIVRFQGFYKKQ